MKKHLKKVAICVALAVMLTGGIIAFGSSGPEDPPSPGIMIHTVK